MSQTAGYEKLKGPLKTNLLIPDYQGLWLSEQRNVESHDNRRANYVVCTGRALLNTLGLLFEYLSWNLDIEMETEIYGCPVQEGQHAATGKPFIPAQRLVAFAGALFSYAPATSWATRPA